MSADVGYFESVMFLISVRMALIALAVFGLIHPAQAQSAADYWPLETVTAAMGSGDPAQIRGVAVMELVECEVARGEGALDCLPLMAFTVAALSLAGDTMDATKLADGLSELLGERYGRDAEEARYTSGHPDEYLISATLIAAHTLHKAGGRAAALALAEQLLLYMQPDSPTYYYGTEVEVLNSVGQFLVLQGKAAAAIPHLRRAIELQDIGYTLKGAAGARPSPSKQLRMTRLLLGGALMQTGSMREGVQLATLGSIAGAKGRPEEQLTVLSNQILALFLRTAGAQPEQVRAMQRRASQGAVAMLRTPGAFSELERRTFNEYRSVFLQEIALAWEQSRPAPR